MSAFLEVPVVDKGGRIGLYLLVEPGQTWQRRDEGAPWRIVSINPESSVVALIGPGPRRMCRTVSWSVFQQEWEPSTRT